jgi:predicted O-methyltransferase YrrM
MSAIGLGDMWSIGVRVARAAAASGFHEYIAQRQRSQEEPEFTSRWSAIEAVPGWLSRPEGAVLYHVARFGPGHGDIVEIGSYQGRSTACLAGGAMDGPGGRVHAVDPHTGDRGQLEQLGVERINTEPAFRRNMAGLGLETAVVPHIATSRVAAEKYDGPPVRLLFIDGWHSTAAVLEDFTVWRRQLAAEAVVVFDDWRTSVEVAEGVTMLRRQGFLPPHAFRIGKMIGFAPYRFRAGRLTLWWPVTDRRGP